MNSPQKEHNTQSLKTATQDYFDDVSLTTDELSQLKQTLLSDAFTHGDELNKKNADEHTDTLNNAHKQKHKRSHWYGYGVAASLLVAMLLVWQQLNPIAGKSDISYLIAKEVAKNHMKLKPLEVASPNFSKVSGYFGKGHLDFKPVPSVFLAKNNVNKLLGARYCSIQSVTAAQIRYKNADGKFVTFYEVGYDADKFGDIPTFTALNSEPINSQKTVPKVHYVNGMKVHIWVEKGLLMASVVNAG